MLTQDWVHSFDHSIPPFVTTSVLDENTKNITFDDVQEWIEENGCVAGRFRWFKVHARQSLFCQLVAKRLLSMRTVGSIDVERQIKPMKNAVITKDRNRLGTAKATVLYRTSENLRHLMKAKITLGKKIT